MTYLINRPDIVRNEVCYDSTTARFWFYNEDARMIIMELLVNKFSNHGIIINEGNYKDYRVPLDVISKSGKPIYKTIFELLP